MKSTAEIQQFYAEVLQNELRPIEKQRKLILPFAVIYRIVFTAFILFFTGNLFNVFLALGNDDFFRTFFYIAAVLICLFILIGGYQSAKALSRLFPHNLNSKRKIFLLGLLLSGVFVLYIRAFQFTDFFMFRHGFFNNQYFWANFASMGKLFLISFASIAIILAFYFIEKKFKTRFKKEILTRLFNFLYPQFQYKYNGVMPLKTFEISGFCGDFPNYKYEGSDYIIGNNSGVDFEFSWINAQRKTHSNNKESIDTIFQGYLYKADFNKKLKGNTVIHPDFAENVFGRLGRSLQKLTLGKKKLVQLENREFEDYFAVYSDNEIEARYILSTSIMERMVNLRKEFNTDLSFTFNNNYIFMGIESQTDLFAPSIFRKNTTIERTEYFANLVDSINNIVEELNLNVKIWGN
jgi:hypothetical protein